MSGDDVAPIVLSEARATEGLSSSSARDNAAMTDAAIAAGFRPYFIPSDFSECETAENALQSLPVQEREVSGIWLGFIPSPERYDEVYEAALRRRIRLVNSSEEHRIALEMDRSLTRLDALTPETAVIESPSEIRAAADRLGFPLFVRGSVRSRKESGWSACVAETYPELEQAVYFLFAWPYRSRGRVLARKLLRLRHTRTTANGFPIGREFRVFLFRDTVIGLGYYWEGSDALSTLSADEESLVIQLATEASRRVNVPFLVVDIGQDETGKWWVIEVGDAQFAGHGQTPLLPLWTNLYRSIVRDSDRT